jgi:hypothetical protein
VHSKKLCSLESCTRQNLERHSYAINAFSQYRRLSWSVYKEFKARHDEILTDLAVTKADILASYDALQGHLLRLYSLGLPLISVHCVED